MPVSNSACSGIDIAITTSGTIGPLEGMLHPEQRWLGGEFGSPGLVAETFGITPGLQRGNRENACLCVSQTASSAKANMLYPGEQGTWELQIVNKTAQAMSGPLTARVLHFGTTAVSGGLMPERLVKHADVAAVTIGAMVIPAYGYVNITLQPHLPETFGSYAVLLDIADQGSFFAFSVARVHAAVPGRVRFPKNSLDYDRLDDIFSRLGVKAARTALSYKPTTDVDFEEWYQEQAAKFRAAHENNITLLATIWNSEPAGMKLQPLGRWRPWLQADGRTMDPKFDKPDMAWLPEYDADLTKMVSRFAQEFGWPNGPITAFALWNEPWEGISICHWGADIPRFREIYTAIAKGVEEARAVAGVQVLMGGCDSSSNTFDKLFPDDSGAFDNRFDICTVHYQGMAPPSLVKQWRERGIMIWDTESWVAGTEDRVPVVMAANRSTGHDRSMGVYMSNVAEHGHVRVYTGEAWETRPMHNAWPIAGAYSAMLRFQGDRDFRELLFPEGLPFIIRLDGLADANGMKDPEDSTLVVVGDIGGSFGKNTIFESVRGLAVARERRELAAQLAAQPAESPERATLAATLATRASLTHGASMRVKADSAYQLYDYMGNLLPAEDGYLLIPLNWQGYYLRGNGQPGAFAQLLAAVRAARVEGYEPLEIRAHDLLAPIAQHPDLRLSLHNVLNRPVTAKVTVTLGNLTLGQAERMVTFQPFETQVLAFPVLAGAAVPSNDYLLSVAVDAADDGEVYLTETMHVNVIAHRTIAVDADLHDWEGVLPQTVTLSERKSYFVEEMWYPMKRFEQADAETMCASAFLAYDAENFYFAVKVADTTYDEGNLRFETRDEDAFFYPEVVIDEAGNALHWPAGVRRYTYTKEAELPTGNWPGHDNVQLSFNVIPQGEKIWDAAYPGTPFGYVIYRGTDYEFALNKVAAQYGGGCEVFCLTTPRIQEKNFYPHQPKGTEGGPVKDAKMAVVHEENTRIIEAAIPWTAMPEVKACLDAGQTIKFTYRVNDVNGTMMDLNSGRSISRQAVTFHVNWRNGSVGNEVEFAFEK